MEKIKIENLSFSYQGSPRAALSDITFSAKSGEFIVVCGRSGCGKSTLLRLISPALAPNGSQSGKIYFENREIKDLPRREQAERIGFIQQNPDNQIVCDKVWHEMAFAMENLGYKSQEIRARISEISEFFGLQSWFYKKTSELSGGQKQLLNLASVLSLRPDVLILDEPTSRLDPIATHSFLETLSRVNKELGTTVIISEHALDEVLPIADKTVLLEGGRIIACGEPRDVGNALKETASDMFSALPTPMRVFLKAQGEGRCPLTVSEGREWLQKQETDKGFCTVDLENKSAVKCAADEAAAAEIEEVKNTPIAFEMRDVWVRYEKNSPDVLKGLSLKVFEGEIYAILGGNGVGKTTAVSTAVGNIKPYRGKVIFEAGKRVSALAQNPQSLFSHKTLRLELENAADAAGGGEQSINGVIEFCELGGLLDMHPYDLSGGEQQRAGIAMVLLTNPDVIFLDEPTKGLDAPFKEKLARLLLSLKAAGKTVVMVSHDIEFCARYASRCTLLFDGKSVFEGDVKELFLSMRFYTTSARRMAQGIIDTAVLEDDILAALGIEEKNTAETFALPKAEKKEQPAKKHGKPLSKKNLVWGLVFLILCVVSAYISVKTADLISEILSMFFLTAAGVNLIPQKRLEIEAIRRKTGKSVSKHSFAAAAAVLILVPLTILLGVYVFKDRRYYFISLLIILEIMLPFLFAFEGRKPGAREVVLLSALCAAAVAGRMALGALPQFKPVVALVIITGACLGGETGFLLGALTAVVSNFYFGQGPWTPWQMFAWGLIGFISGVAFRFGAIKSRLSLCVFGFLATLAIHGGIMNTATVLMMQQRPDWSMILKAMEAGLVFDLIHALSTAMFLWLAAEPMFEKLNRIKIKYGIF